MLTKVVRTNKWSDTAFVALRVACVRSGDIIDLNECNYVGALIGPDQKEISKDQLVSGDYVGDEISGEVPEADIFPLSDTIVTPLDTRSLVRVLKPFFSFSFGPVIGESVVGREHVRRGGEIASSFLEIESNAVGARDVFDYSTFKDLIPEVFAVIEGVSADDDPVFVANLVTLWECGYRNFGYYDDGAEFWAYPVCVVKMSD